MLSLECPTDGVLRVIIPPNAKRQVIGRMRAAVSEHYMSAFIANPEQGKIFGATSRHGTSNHFIRTGQYRFTDWRFVHRARLDVLPINGVPRWGEGDRRCLRCGYQLEMLPHMLCLCGPQAAFWQLRHNAFFEKLEAASRLPGESWINTHALRPAPRRRTAGIASWIDKIHIYQPLAETLRRRGYIVNVQGFVVGAVGV
ncbi:unnamed protein product [Heterotrigona itama]|uniref:Uncharacterized protein n=1 Tax=Heterotrigona itama TaxID=395501 RepID=A0A6V7HJJ2_9HYME|nr:unnamed protein product [Heterotrigona itama]